MQRNDSDASIKRLHARLRSCENTLERFNHVGQLAQHTSTKLIKQEAPLVARLRTQLNRLMRKTDLFPSWANRHNDRGNRCGSCTSRVGIFEWTSHVWLTTLYPKLCTRLGINISLILIAGGGLQHGVVVHAPEVRDAQVSCPNHSTVHHEVCYACLCVCLS